ncbi:MAG: hypothetical protein JXB49_13585 [Bacteroidales bacterium]|nr:hypothetical protein [Bacteroidales bacterium]
MMEGSVTKKIIGLFITIITMGLVVWGVIYLKKQKVEITDVYQVIPTDATIIIESRSLTELAKKWENIQFLTSLDELKIVNNIHSGILFLDSIFNNNPEIKSVFETNPLVISLHLSGKDQCNAIFYIKLKEKGQDDSFVTFAKKITEKKYEVNERKYEHTKIYDFTAHGSVKPGDFSCAFTHDICVISFSSLLLESAIRQANADIKIKDQTGFLKVYETAGKYVDANLYVNHQNLAKFTSVALSPAKQSKILNAPLLANWTELDITIKNTSFLLNGFTFSNDSTNQYLNIFKNQEPQKNTLEEYIPADVSAFLFMGIEDNIQFRKDFKSYLTKDGKINKYNQEVNKINNLTGANIEEIFNAIVDREIALAITRSNDFENAKNSFSIIKTKSKSETKKALIEILQNFAEKENSNVNDNKYTYRVDNETQFDIYKFPANKLIYTLYGEVFANTESSYFTILDNYLIFGPSIKGLSDFLYLNVLHKTLSNDNSYKQFTDYLSGKTNLFIYANTDKGYEYISHFLNTTQKKAFKDNFDILKKYQLLACQFNTSEDMFFTNCAIQCISEYQEAPHTVWESLLDTIIDFKPRLLVNHNTNDKEIFVQDLKNNIYLINKAGRILWKLPLHEKIMSDIFQVDFYKNNKLQILFNTKSQLHLIDRNGNYVERYPVTLRSTATNGMALFDYENNQDYRIFIAGEDRQIYVYDKEGNVIPGWEFEGSESIISNEVQHFRLGDKDYIVFADKNRVYILDRKGNTRVPLSTQFCKSNNNLFVLEEETTNSKARLAVTDTAGRIFYIYFDGKVEKVSLGSFSPSHYFDYQDFDADGKKDYIILDKNKLAIYNQVLKELFSCKFDEEINSPPAYYHFSQNDRKIGIVSKKSNKIYLFSKDGSTYKGFPLKGYTPFSIGIFQETGNNFNLIVGSSDGFLYNYSVQ